MSAPDLLHRLRSAGLVLTLTPGGGLHVAPRSALSDEHRSAIRSNRDALVAALQAEAMQPTEAMREAYEERAAIMEFCGGLARGEAERLAALQTPPTAHGNPAAALLRDAAQAPDDFLKTLQNQGQNQSATWHFDPACHGGHALQPGTTPAAPA